MSTPLQLAYGIVTGRAHTDRDAALLRDMELARKSERGMRRTGRRRGH
ncbi:hypothetical protein ACT8ZV_11650 [Nocardioides sp. MAHUQ-72]